MLAWVRSLADFVNGALATPFGAIVIALVISWCWTQSTKGLPVWDRLTDLQHRWAVRLGAFLSGFIPALVLWPVRDARAVVYAVAVGLASPIAYTLTVRTVGHRWPWLVAPLSARPVPKPPGSNDFHSEN